MSSYFLAGIHGDPIIFRIRSGFVNQTQSQGLFNPVRSGPGFLNPVQFHLIRPILVLLTPQLGALYAKK